MADGSTTTPRHANQREARRRPGASPADIDGPGLKVSSEEASSRRAVSPTLVGGAALAAVASAVALGKALRPKPHRVLGISVRRSSTRQLSTAKPGRHSMRSLVKSVPRVPEPDLDTIGNVASRAGQQLGRMGSQAARLAGQVERAGQATERVGRLLAKS